MKSSTVKRSTLSKESMDIIETIANEESVNMEDYNNEENNIPGEYVRENSNTPENKAQEIDLLWQTFKSAQFNTSSPLLWAITGFVAGTVITLSFLGMFGMISFKHTDKNTAKVTAGIEKINEDQNINQEIENAKIMANEDLGEVMQNNEAPQQSETAEKTPSQPKNFKKYTIKDGDTVEAIIKHFYGRYTPERAQAIMDANNLKNLDRISIGQVLIIPIEE